MTPWQLGVCIGAFQKNQKQKHEHDSWLMWHSAALPRLKKFPPLSDFIGEKTTGKGIDERAIMARLKAYKKRVAVECPS